MTSHYKMRYSYLGELSPIYATEGFSGPTKTSMGKGVIALGQNFLSRKRHRLVAVPGTFKQFYIPGYDCTLSLKKFCIKIFPMYISKFQT